MARVVEEEKGKVAQVVRVLKSNLDRLEEEKSGYHNKVQVVPDRVTKNYYKGRIRQVDDKILTIKYVMAMLAVPETREEKIKC